MKIFILLLLFGFMQLNASVFSQGSKVAINEKDISLEELFWKIQEETNFVFVFSQEHVKEHVNLSVEIDGELDEVLTQILTDKSLTYEKKHDVYVIKKAPRAVASVQQPEKLTISGVVYDDEGDPLPFVNVFIKGETQGVITDKNGAYTIEVVRKEGMIVVASFIGFVTKEVPYEGQSIINITLVSDITDLGEVVVTGYQTISRERATGSFDKISVEQINKPSSNISERLVGVMAGIQQMTDANGNTKFEIRGQTSLLAESQPLIVVDGFALTREDKDDFYTDDGNDFIINPFETINPNDIESITVLKDAAAASIWGARSANGVIVITTKKAKKGKARVSVSSFAKFSNKLDLDYVNPIATSAETIEYEKTSFNSNHFGSSRPMPSFVPWNASSATSQALIAMNEHRLGRISEADMNATLSRLAGLNNQSQIKEHLLQAPITQQYNVNISGGSESMQNVLSLMFENRKDNFKENNNDRYMINYRTNLKVAKWLDFSFSGMMQMNNATNNGVSLSDIKSLSPYDMLKNEDGTLTNLNNHHFYTPIIDEIVPTELFPYSNWAFNPITEINNRERTVKDINSRIQAGLTFKLLKGLTFNTKFQYEMFNKKRKSYYNENTFEVRNTINTSSSWNYNPLTAPTPNLPNGGILTLRGDSPWDPTLPNLTEVRTLNYRNQLNFVRSFTDKHAVNAVIGTETLDRVVETTINPTTYGYDDDKLTVGQFLNGTEGIRGWNGWPAQYFADFNYTNRYTYTTDRYFSLYGNLAYTYNNKYTLSGSLRTDASNLITDDPSYRYNPFWSIGGSWQAHKEHFLNNVKWIDRLNVRTTYGFNGNVDKSTSFKPLIATAATQDRFTEDYLASISSYGNPTLRWEKTKSINAGIDFSLFNSKLFGSVDYYHKQSYDLIVRQSISPVHGTSSKKLNNGEMINKGIEVKLGTSLNLVENNIVWSGNLNLSYNKNKVQKLYKSNYSVVDLPSGGTTAYASGYDANTLWSMQYAGLLNIGTDTDPKYTPTIQGVEDDQYTLSIWPPRVDAREYLIAEGTKVAPYLVGFSNNFKIYNFDLSFIFSGKFGHKFRRQHFNYPSLGSGINNVNNSYSEVLNADPNNIVPLPQSPEPRYYFWDRFYPYMSYLTENASHIRFQELNLTYNLSKKILDRVGISSLSIYAQANNLGTILFNDYDEDPEYPKGTLRPQTTYTFGLKFNL